MLSTNNLYKLRDKPLYNSEDLMDHKAISMVVYNNSKEILMQDHIKYNFWTIPIGKVKLGQKIEEAAKEELYEECNIKVQKIKELAKKSFVYMREGKSVRVISYLFEIQKWSGTIKNMEPQKHREIRFMTIEEISKLPHLSDMTLLFLETKNIIRPKSLI